MKKTSQKLLAISVIFTLFVFSLVCVFKVGTNNTTDFYDNDVSQINSELSEMSTQNNVTTTKSDYISLYPVNSNGQTYGNAVFLSEGTEALPDLLATIGNNNQSGYIYRDDFLGKTQDSYKHYKEQVSDENILRWLRSEYKDFVKNKEDVIFYEEKYDVPVYAVDGITIIDNICFCIGYSWE